MKMMVETRTPSQPMRAGAGRAPAPARSVAPEDAPPAERSASSRAIRAMLAQGETARVTFAPAVGDAFEMSRLVASFANAQGGLILFGAQPPQTIVGCNVQLAQRVLDEARAYLEPNPTTAFHTIEVDGKPLAAIQVWPSSALVLSAGGAFVRDEAEIVPMTAGDLTRRATKQATALGGKNVAAKSASLVGEVEPIVRATVMPLARAIVQQTQIIERLHDDLAAAARFESRAKEWFISALIGAFVGQLVAAVFG